MTDAYFDCFSGISGDMTLGALLDLGVPLDWLKKQLKAVPLDGYTLSVKTMDHHGIQARKFNVDLRQQTSHRNYADVKKIITGSRLSRRAKQTSLAIFALIADAEAQIHGVPKDSVHFHEVGAVDSLVDIIGTALCLEYLNIERVVSSSLPLGKGTVTSQHGILPVPAPATLAILAEVPVYGCGIAAEMITPTGAAIIKALADSFGDLPAMTIERIGYGAGSRRLTERPNVLRVVTGHMQKKIRPHKDNVVMIETCVDDMNPEIFGYLMETLFRDGALDVYWIPVFMKKNRPGTLIQVLCNPASRQIVSERILSETTSTGIRYRTLQRMCLPREIVRVSSEFGEVEMKQITGLDGSIRLTPEYETCKRIAREEKISIRDVYARIHRSAVAPDPKPILDKTRSRL
jgi:uncharacterized protein (TIGR00299 family) protein